MADPQKSPASVSTNVTDTSRTAPWLHSSYDAEVWVVSDTLDHARRETIFFALRMPDGRLLTDHQDFYSSIKEYAWWVRDVRISRTETADLHVQLVRALMHLAHRLSLDGLTSFEQVQPLDVDAITEDSCFGVDRVLRASLRLKERLQSACDEMPLVDPFASLRRHSPASRIPREVVLEWCHIPARIGMAGAISDVLDEYAEPLLITRHYGKKSKRDSEKTLSPHAIHRYLVTLEHLYMMRRFSTAATITFEPFPEGARRVADVMGLASLRTAVAPPRLMLTLLERAAVVIANFERPSRNEATNLDFATAAWILVAAFTGRRKEEIGTLKVGCSLGDRQTGWWVRCRILKTLKRDDVIPIPEIVHRAVEVMTQLGKGARTSSGNDVLFQVLGHDGKSRPLPIARLLDQFAHRHGVSRGEAHESPADAGWHWHPHQFRRFFAVLYFYRFEGASIEALSHHLRHFSLNMTRRYITQDPESAAIWTDVEWGYMGDVARSIVAGQRSVAGGMGDRFNKAQRRLLDVLRKSVIVTSPERIGAALKLLMRREGLVFNPKPWVLCSCPETMQSGAKAACRRASGVSKNVVGPDFAFAGPTVCANCPYAVVEQRTFDALSMELGQLEDASKTGMQNTVFQAWQKSRLVEVHALVDRFQNSFGAQNAGYQ